MQKMPEIIIPNDIYNNVLYLITIIYLEIKNLQRITIF